MMYPKLETSVGLAFIGLPEGKEVSPLFMFDLAAVAKNHLLSAEYGDNEEFTFPFSEKKACCCEYSFL